MKKQLLAIVLPLCLMASASAFPPKFDAFSRMALSVPADTAAFSRASVLTDAFVTLTHEGLPFSAEEYGLETLSELGDIVIVRGTAAQLEVLAADDRVASVSLSRQMCPANDKLRGETGAEVLGTASGYGNAVYTGHGVLTGLYDTGFDMKNPAFWRDGHSRARRIWHYTGPEGTHTEYSVPALIDAFITDDNSGTHGSHVLGTMAGCDKGRPYSGMAPEADIAVACGPLTDTNIADGVAQIAKYAASEGLPCVINLSISDFLGPHDGTDPFTRALSAATAESGDAILVVSAGNEYTFKRSLSRRFGHGQTAVQTFIRPETSAGEGRGGIAIWSGDNAPVKLTLVLADTPSGKVSVSYPIEANGDSVFVLATKQVGLPNDLARMNHPDFEKYYRDSYVAVTYSDNAGTNGRPSYFVSFDMNYAGVNADGHFLVGLIIEGVDGHRVDVTLSGETANLSGRGMEGWTNGCDEFSISSMACAEGAVSVGAYVSRTEWTSTDGKHHEIGSGYTVGDIAPWSSRGTTVDGRTLPHVAAPGAAVVSVLSTHAVDNSIIEADDIVSERVGGARTDYWGVKWGTSMSSPAVAGCIALWLEADPSLTAADVLEIVAKTSRRDEFVERNPEAWGAGKFDAVAGLAEVLRRKASLAGPSAVTPGDIDVRRDGDCIAVTVPGLDTFEVRLTDMAGRVVAVAEAESGTAHINGARTRGIYLVTAGTQTRKIILR